jgi:hypothetical protein
MPTATGMLRQGDRLIHPSMPKVVFEVVERTSNSPMDYGAWIKRADGKVLPDQLRRRRERCRNRGREYVLDEVGFLVFRVNGGWKLIDATRRPS